MKVQVPKKKDINNKTPKKVRKWKEETVNNSGKNEDTTTREFACK